MPPIEIGPNGLPAARAVGALDGRSVKSAQGQAQRPASASPAIDGGTIVRAEALDAGTPPFDAERVSTIRKAIEKGEYPVIPMRVADAMIAAGYLLRSGQ